MKTVNVIISGRVQGVAYRYWTQSEALRRFLTGIVRNRRDGSVEAIFSGEDENVDGMVAACESGPPLAKVISVECRDVDDTSPYTGFEITGTRLAPACRKWLTRNSNVSKTQMWHQGAAFQVPE